MWLMYVSIEELDNIISILATKVELDKIGYSGLDIEVREQLIKKAMSVIDMQLFRGRKVSNTQENAFPRIVDGSNTLIPPSVKYATASYVLQELKTTSSKRLQLQNEGVVSIDTGGVKESYSKDTTKDMWLMYLNRYLY